MWFERLLSGPFFYWLRGSLRPNSTPEFSMGLETDNPVFSTTIPKRCEVFSSLSARIRRGFGEDFFEVRAPKMQLALRLEFLEIRTGRYIPES